MDRTLCAQAFDDGPDPGDPLPRRGCPLPVLVRVLKIEDARSFTGVAKHLGRDAVESLCVGQSDLGIDRAGGRKCPTIA